MKLTVTIEGVEHEVPQMGLANSVRFERHFGIPASVLDPADPTPNRQEWTAFVIYRGLIKAGVFPPTMDFDTALDILEDADLEQTLEEGDDGYEAGEGDAEADPTNASCEALPAS